MFLPMHFRTPSSYPHCDKIQHFCSKINFSIIWFSAQKFKFNVKQILTKIEFMNKNSDVAAVCIHVSCSPYFFLHWEWDNYPNAIFSNVFHAQMKHAQKGSSVLSNIGFRNDNFTQKLPLELHEPQKIMQNPIYS